MVSCGSVCSFWFFCHFKPWRMAKAMIFQHSHIGREKNRKFNDIPVESSCLEEEAQPVPLLLLLKWTRLWREVEFRSANASPPRSSRVRPTPPPQRQAWLSVGWNNKCASDIPCFKLLAESVDLKLIWIYFPSDHHDREAVLSMGSVWVKRKVWKQC